MDIVVNEPKVAGAIADFNATKVPDEIKDVVVDLENIDNLLSSKEVGATSITSGGKEISTVVPDAKKEGDTTNESTKTGEKVEQKKETSVQEVVKEKKVEGTKVEKKDEKKVNSVLKAPDSAKKDDTKVENKTDVKSAPLIKPITPVKEKADDKADTFDYTGYAPQEVTNMKNMSRQSREAYAEVLKQNRELSKLKDSTYLQHENAYTLSPEYGQLRQKGYMASSEAQVWEKALLQIKAGKPFKAPVGIDKNGQIVLGEDIQPSDAYEIQVNNNLLKCQQVLNQVEGEIQQFPNRYKQQVGTDLQAIRETQKNLFAWHQDPKLMDYKVDVDGAGEKTLKQIKDDIKSIFPIYMQSHPAIDVVGDMMIALKIRDAELREARESKKTTEIELEDTKRGEPSSSSLPDEQTSKGKPTNGMPKEFSVPSTLNI